MAEFKRQPASPSRKLLVRESPSKILTENWRDVLDTKTNNPHYSSQTKLSLSKKMVYTGPMTRQWSTPKSKKQESILPDIHEH